MTAEIFYKERLNNLLQTLKALTRKKSIFGLLRLGSIIALIAAFYFLWSLGLLYVFGVTVLLLFIFIQLIHKDLANKAAISHLQHLIKINEDEIAATLGNYFQFEEGNQFIPKDHFYANDMDVFGHASLYQFLNRTSSQPGATQLAGWLLNPATAKEIMERQVAIKELKLKPEWRQGLQAFGKEQMITHRTQQRLEQWFTEPTIFSQFKHWNWLRYVLPAIILLITVAVYVDYLSMGFWYGTLLVYAIIAFQLNKIIAPLHEQLGKIVNELNTLFQSIQTIENENFLAPLLLQLQGKYHTKNEKASVKIRHLAKILDRLDIRYNIVISAPLNIFLLWNLQQVLDLEKWKKKNKEEVKNWFSSMGIFEALNSFATIHFNNPDWVFPHLKEEHFFIEATALGHPLIKQNKRINNFISIPHKEELMLVTGSNMAGKSTYLRSVGINVILCMAGAPVCAESFTMSPVQLISSMRIADNLEESTSTFYAELKKLKTIIDKVNNDEKVFVLLDEILRGTNSFDRHTGSVALVKQLLKKHAVAIIATHDIALADLQKEYPDNMLNYHFDVQVNDEELFFDYKLKPGVCTSMNASILMKKIGIEL